MAWNVKHALRQSAPIMALNAAKKLWADCGFVRSAREGRCVDVNGRPIPWYTYAAVWYLRQLDFSDKDVFEFGSGQSTLFWAERARRVVSVEDDETWYHIVRQKLAANCELVLETDLSAYADTLHRYGNFDVIVVDGAARGHTRLKCARNAVQHLRAGGMIVLDNSDWLPMSAQFLRDAGLLEVDMAGFVPLTDHTQTTSLFFHRSFSFPSVGRQPQPAPGAVLKTWENRDPVEQPLVHFDGEVFGPVNGDTAFQWETPEGTRRFRLITCAATQERGRAAAILDLDRGRVLLSINEGSPTEGASPELDAVASAPSMTWHHFQAFVSDHQKRRYRL